MGLRRALAVTLCALVMGSGLPAFAPPAGAEVPGEPAVSSLDMHRRLAAWTFNGPAGYVLDGVTVNGSSAELEVNLTTGLRMGSGTLTTSDFSLENLAYYDYLETDSDVPEGCRLSFYTSADAGASWSAVLANGSLHREGTPQAKLRVRAELRSSGGTVSPVLRSIRLYCIADRLPLILSLTSVKGPTVFKRDPATINSKVVDPDGDALTYLWTQTEGADTRLGRADQPSLTFTPLYNGPHRFRLSVSDCYGPPQDSSITVDVVNHPPTITFETDGIPYKEADFHIFASAFSSDSPLAQYDWTLVKAPPFTTMIQPTKPDIVLHAFFTGECTVSLTVTDDQGTFGTGNITFEFIGHPPRATLAAGRNDGHAGQEYTFDASGSTDPDGDTLQYRFDFGDGTVSDWVNFPDIGHFYERSGYFTVRVRVRDVDGLVSDAQYPVHVKPRNQPPAAAFTVTAGDLASPFSFASLSTDADGAVVWTDWDFGDGVTASGPTANHTYTGPGNYTVRLWVRDDDGETASATARVNLNRPPALVSRSPPGDFALSPGKGFNLSVEAVDPDGDLLSYSWSVNGEPLTGETSNTHRFVPGKASDYDITVSVDDGRGGGTNYTWNLTISQPPAPPPQPLYALIAVIVVALVAQGAYLSREGIKSRARRRLLRAQTAAAARPLEAPPAVLAAPQEKPAATGESPPPAAGPAARTMSPLEWSYDGAMPPPMPPPELPPPEAPLLYMEPPEAQPVMEELPEPEPLAEILRPEQAPPYRPRPPPF